MDSQAQARTTAFGSGRQLRGLMWLVAAYLIVVASLWIGVSQVASLSGELPVYDPTAGEHAVWASGQILSTVGGALLIAWGVAVAGLRTRIRLSRGEVAVVIAAGFFVAIVGTLLVWMLAVPQLSGA